MRPNHDTMIVITAIVLALAFVGTVEARAQGVRGFGVPPGKLPFRGFGNPQGEEALRVRFPEAAASITGDDRSLARKQISITDSNGDGVVTQREWTDSEYQSPARFPIYDLNADGILTFYEHSIGIARWRRRNERREDQPRSLRLAAAQTSNAAATPSAVLKEPPNMDPQVVARTEQVQKLADSVIQVYDINNNRVIERNEFQNSSSEFGNIAAADSDRDGEIQRDEIADWLHRRLPPLSRLAMELQSRDLDFDGQVSFSEFSAVTDSRSIDEFSRWDRNGDGLITPRESQPPQDLSSKYDNSAALVIKPGASVVSEIWVEDEWLIDRLQVHVKITKENDNFTALFLIGPAGKRVTLYAGDGWQPWRGAAILNGVTFSDAARPIKETQKQPPYLRQLRPPGKGTNHDPTLDSFRGQSARGTWRLIVRNQDDLVGLLLDWSLSVTPKRGSG